MGKKKKPVPGQTEYETKAATNKQLAEIDRLTQLCRGHASSINQPASYLFTIGITTLLFSLLINRENAPFHQAYLQLLDDFFKRFRPEELTLALMQTSKAETEANIQKVNETCLIYFSLLNERITEFIQDLHLNQAATERVLNSFKGGVFGNKALPAPDAEKLLAAIYGAGSPIEAIRQNCLSFCNSLIKQTDFPANVLDKILDGNTDLSRLRLFELFQATERLAIFIRGFSYQYFEGLLTLGEKYDRFRTLEYQTGIINLGKMLMVGLNHQIVSPILNYFFPFGVRQNKLPVLPKKEGLLTESEASLFLKILQPYEQSLQVKANRHAQFANTMFLLLAGGALLCLFAFGLSGMPGELAFFLLSVLASASYQIIFSAKQFAQEYYINKRVDKVDSYLKDFFEESCFIKLIRQHPFQFEIIAKKKKFNKILERCFQSHGIPIKHNRIGYSGHLSQKTLQKIAEQFNQACERLNQLDELTKLFESIQKQFNPSQNLLFEKCFDVKGYPSATWYLLTSDFDSALELQNRLGKGHCNIQEKEDGVYIISIDDQVTLSNEDFKDFLDSLKKEMPKENDVFFPVDKNSDERTSPIIRQIKSKKTKEESQPERKIFSEITLPGIYSEAKRMHASFLPLDANIWVLFAAKRGDFPSEACYEKFKDLLSLPIIVPPVDKQGLVFDEKLSRPRDRRWKAKVLGEYGMFRLRASQVKKVKTEDGQIHQVHIFNWLELAHR